MTMAHRELFLDLLHRCVTDARISFVTDDVIRTVGTRPGAADGQADVSVRVHNPRLYSRVLAYRNLGLGEAYMDRDFDMEDGNLEDFVSILLRNRINEKVRQHPGLAVRLGWIQATNWLRAKHQNVQRHYDVGDDLFETMLDSSLAYSCGYKRSEHDTLADLQRNKFDRICQKLKVRPGDRLLDIGCGFGGLLMHAAKTYGATGVGVTNSRRHCERGNAQIAATGLAHQVQIEYRDFRKVTGEFDKVVSVGMMEHVPRREYRAYFDVIKSVLVPGGMGLVHAIGCNGPRNHHDPFIQKYVFPGSGQPKLSEMADELEQHRLAILDVENIGRHYEPTLRGWLKNFRVGTPKLAAAGYDATFLRMWEYYLACSIALAAVSNTSAVYHVLFTNGVAPLPLYRV
jgi:cyclopropane-fatty-acyl-phospholipid synthase